jgi:aspartate aminotransferase
VDDNYSHYTPVPGYLDAREAVCVKLKRDNNLDYKPENIVLSTGAKQSLANVILATVDQGDEVIIPAPFWVTYSELVKIAGGVPVILTTKMENKYKITGAELEAAITPKTKVFLFSSPCNPSGSVYSYDELKSLADVFAKYPEIFIISDEIYEYINFVGKHESIAQFDAIKNQVIIVNGLSKGYAMTGYRLGYIAANVDVAKGCEKLQGQFTSGTNAVTQRAAIDALVGDQAPTIAMTKEFERRKKRVLELVSEIPGWKLAEPDGAFYVFPQVSAYFGKSDGTNVINDADDLCMYLLNVAHVSTVTGRAFGTPDCIRLSFANSLEKIEEAYKRIKAALAKLN